MKIPDQRLLSPDEVCRLLGLASKATLYAQRTRNEAPGSLAIRVGRHLRWDPVDLAEWIEAQKAPESEAKHTAHRRPLREARNGSHT